MADTTPNPSPIREIQIEALVAMRIIKHSTSAFPTPATGCLVGMDVPASTANTTSTSTSATQLQITNCFPYPASVPEPNAQTDGYYQQQDAASLAAAAPRAKSNVGYQNEMVKLLREVNVDAQVVGWYISANMGSFVNLNFVENQAFFQRQEEGASGAAGGAGRLAVALVFDVGRSVSGSLSLKAYRLGEKFMVAWREGKFTTESIQRSNLRYQDILVEIPIQIHNSHLLTSYLHQLPTPPPPKNSALDFPTSLSQLSHDPSLTPTPLNPNLETLDLSIDPFLERTTDNLLDSIEAHQIELNNAQYYQRSLAREQAKIQAWQTKRKQENVLRVQQKQTPLDESEWTKLFKLPTEPSRLEGMLVGRQVEQYGRMVDGFSAGVSGKMFAVRGGLVPGDAN